VDEDSEDEVVGVALVVDEVSALGVAEVVVDVADSNVLLNDFGIRTSASNNQYINFLLQYYFSSQNMIRNILRRISFSFSHSQS
jgi:hypothetical protein